ncbi:hypothetical protein [Flavobacterium sp. N1736]|uniref:hypothetical protein n=1 Tax=Flavobacterium sp. N1736 TaxID=2986823 RepID=UPI0022252841|nr:hypothetical protein [Flavobacterium sp. N1736]
MSNGQQTAIGSAISSIAANWDEWGIKDWANKNINGDKISQWFKSKISFKNLFGGGHKNSGPPPNMSKYANINSQNPSINVNSTKGSLPCTGNCDGWMGTEYIGPTPIATYYKKETAVDMVDLAAQKHDAGYIYMGADGISGALFDLNVLKYDQKLYNDSKKVYNDYYNYTIDSQTRQPISFQTQLRAAAVMSAFGPIIQVKQGLLNARTTYQDFIFSKNQFFKTLYF